MSEEPDAVEILTVDDYTDCGVIIVGTSFDQVEKIKDSSTPDMMILSKLFQCELCDKTFTQASNLKRHERTHTGERPFSCPQCDRCFAQGNNLKAHMRLHTGERPYACALCDRTFAQSSNLYKHMRNHSDNVDNEQSRRYGCAVCGKWFYESNMLKMHLRTHTGERPYACDQCERTFAQESNLRRHRRIHTGEKPYKCPVCSRCFSQSNNVKAHMSVHESGVCGSEDANVSTTSRSRTETLLECDEELLSKEIAAAAELDRHNAVVATPTLPKIVVISKHGRRLEAKRIQLGLTASWL